MQNNKKALSVTKCYTFYHLILDQRYPHTTHHTPVLDIFQQPDMKIVTLDINKSKVGSVHLDRILDLKFKQGEVS